MILEPLIPFGVARSRVGIVMAAAVGFEDDLALGAREVGDPRTDLMLAPELEATESLAADVRPQDSFGFSLFPSISKYSRPETGSSVSFWGRILAFREAIIGDSFSSFFSSTVAFTVSGGAALPMPIP